MDRSNPFEVLKQNRVRQQEQVRHLGQVAHLWKGAIRAGLRRLAQALWPNRYLLGVFPLHRYRLRHQATSDSHVWWVEHDVPPYDKYLCAAYRVQLTLDDRCEPVLTVQSRDFVYPVDPLTKENLDMALAQAGAAPPLVIPRKMGEASDP